MLFTSCGGAWSQPASLTYSYRNLFDGGVVGVSNLTMLQAVEEVLGLWARYAPFTFREVASGPITFGHEPLDGTTVGQATCPPGGDVSFDSSSRTFSVSLFLETAAHELGHALGMGHSTELSLPVDRPGGQNQPIMNPGIQGVYGGLGSTFLYQDDVDGIRARYGTGSGEVITTRSWIAAADGDWDTDASWGPTINGANFEPTTNSDVTIQGGRTVTVASGMRRARTVTLGSTDGQTGALNVTGGSLTARRDLLIGINGAGTLTITNGTVTAVGLTYGGNSAGDQELVHVNGGSLILTAPVTDGTGTSTLQISAGTLNLNNNAVTVDRFVHNGGSFTNVNGPLTIRNLLQVRNVILGIPNILLQGGFTLDATATGAATVSSNFDLGGGTRTFTIPDTSASGVDAFVSGVLSNGGLTKTGAGTLRLQGTSTYTGTTNVNQGELFVTGSISSSSLTSVGNSAFLRGTGTVGAMTVSGTVRPGASPGTLTVNGNYSQGVTGRLEIELGGTVAGTDYDVLQVNGSASLLGQLNVNLINGFTLTPGATFDVLRASSIMASGLTLTGVPAGSMTMNVVNVGAEQVLRLTVVPQTLRVASFNPTNSGFLVQLSRALNVGVLNLYDADNSLGAADVVVVGDSTGAVRGSVVLNAAGDGLTFLRTGGVLPADTYTVTLRSAADGFKDTDGALLDGNADGTPGDNFTTTFTIASSTAVTVSVSDFMRGPGQVVTVPATGPGLPLRLSEGANVTAVTLTLLYNSALLRITGAAVGGTVPGGATASVNTSTPGQAVLTFNSPTALSSGGIDFVTLMADVPNDAPYTSKHVLNLTNIQINTGSIASRDDDGIHIVGYFADTTGNAGYSSTDATRALRVAVALDSGFAAFQLADPVLIADINASGGVTATDATRILQEVVGLDQSEIPALPGVIPPIVPGGPDPLLYLPKQLKARAGGLVTVPLLLDPSDGLESADLALDYNPSRLELVAVKRGRLTRDFDLFATNVDAAAGTVRVGLGRSAGPIANRGKGSVLTFVFRVRADAAPGSAVVNLRQSLNGTTTQLNEGGLVLGPAPSDASGDALDGSILISAARRGIVPNAGVVDLLRKRDARGR